MTPGGMMLMRRAAVVGAGAAGLCAAKRLLERDIEVTVFELGTRVGGLWVYDNETGRSPAYASLHTNTAAATTGYRDFPMSSTPVFPTHKQVAAYLQAYAERFDLERHIRFGTGVTAVRPLADAGRTGWRVGLADGSEEDFDTVVVATGHQSTPAHPAFARDFTGEYLHAHSYRVPDPFRDKRVLVVGTGNSALDIAADVCTVTEITTISSRSPVLIMPRMFLGRPTAELLGRIEKPWLPWPIVRRIRGLITRLAHGRMEDWGFRTPKKRTHPASHPTIFGHMAWNRITVRPGVSAVRDTEVHFTDGSTERFDTMIAATGYEIDLPFLSATVSPVVERRVDLYRRIVVPDWPGLYFIGYFNLSGGGNIRMMDIQARWLAAVLVGDVVLPDRAVMKREIAAENRRMARRYPGSARYGLELEPREYGAAIREDMAGARQASTSSPASRKMSPPPALAR